MNKRQKKKHYNRVLSDLWARIGFIIQLSQMIEYNLLNILAGHKYLYEIDGLSIFDYEGYYNATKNSNDILKNNKISTLRKLLIKVEKENIFTDEFIKLLDEAIIKRNYYVHQFFKEQLGKNILETNPSYYFKELSETITLLNYVNKELLKIDYEYRRVAKDY